MGKYRKLPVIIEATQWYRNGDHPNDGPSDKEGKIVRRFNRPDIDGLTPCPECDQPTRNHGWIDTLEEGHRVCPSDWIITGVNGEMYPCKSDIFWKTYEEVE